MRRWLVSGEGRGRPVWCGLRGCGRVVVVVDVAVLLVGEKGEVAKGREGEAVVVASE